MRKPHEGCRAECVRIAACDRDPPRPASWHRRGHCRRRGEPCAGLRQRGPQRGAKIPPGTACGARPRRDRPHPRHRPRCDPASSRRLGLLRSDRALPRQCAIARHRPAGPHRRQRGRPAPAAVFPRRRLGRTNAAADGKRGSDRRHRREGRRPLVRARHAARALWRVPRRATASRRDRAGQRRHRQFRQRRRRRRTCAWARNA